LKKEKILLELEKARQKVAEYQARVKQLEKLKVEAENVEITNALRGFNMTHDELLAFLKQCKAEEITPVQSKNIMKESENNNDKKTE
jgi:hypothetical protein